MQAKFFLLFLALLASLSLISAAKPRIYGGTLATANQFPAICKMSISYGEDQFTCGASIILNGYYILTAAHCVEPTEAGLPTQISCLGGVTNLESNATTRQKRFYLKTTIHADYNSETFVNDVALIQLKTPFHLTDSVKEILPAESAPAVGTDVYAAGWGTINDGTLPEDLRWTELQYLNGDVCASEFSNYDPSIQVCAGTTTGKDTCQGDSGGPLYMSSSTTSFADAKLLGLTSYGGDCGVVPGGVYVNVPGLAHSWVKSVLTDAVCQENCQSMKSTCDANTKKKPAACKRKFKRCNRMCSSRTATTF